MTLPAHPALGVEMSPSHSGLFDLRYLNMKPIRPSAANTSIGDLSIEAYSSTRRTVMCSQRMGVSDPPSSFVRFPFGRRPLSPPSPMALDTHCLIIPRHPSTGFSHRRVGNKLILVFPDNSIGGIIFRPSLIIGYLVWIPGSVFPPSSNLAQYRPRRATTKFLRDGGADWLSGYIRVFPIAGRISHQSGPHPPLKPDNPNPLNRDDVFANAIRRSKSRARRKPPHADALLPEPSPMFILDG